MLFPEINPRNNGLRYFDTGSRGPNKAGSSKLLKCVYFLFHELGVFKIITFNSKQ